MGAHKLLLVDSHQDFGDSFIKVSQADEIEFHYAFTADEGKRMALEIMPDTILIDVNLPDSNGFALFTSLKKQKPLAGSRFVIVGAGVTPETFDNHGKLKRHANLYLHKPFKAHELLLKLNEALNLNFKVEIHEEEIVDPFGLEKDMTENSPKVVTSETDTLDELDSLLGDISESSLIEEDISDDADLSELDKMLGLETAPVDMPDVPVEAGSGPPPLPVVDEAPLALESEVLPTEKAVAESPEILEEVSQESLLEEIVDEESVDEEPIDEEPVVEAIIEEIVDEVPEVHGSQPEDEEEQMVIERSYYGEEESDVSTGDAIEAAANKEEAEELEELDELSDDELVHVAEKEPFGVIKEKVIGDIPDEPLLGELDEEEDLEKAEAETKPAPEARQTVDASVFEVANNELKKQNDSLVQKAADLESELDRMKQALLDAEKKTEEKSAKADTFWKEVKQLEEKLKERSEEHLKLKEKVKLQFEDIKAAHGAELKSLKGELSQTRDASVASQENFAEQNTQLKAKLETMKLDTERLEQQIESDNLEHKERMEEQHRHTEFLEQERETLSKQLMEHEEKNNRLKAEYEADVAELKSSFEKITEARELENQARVTELEERFKAKEGEIEQLLKESQLKQDDAVAEVTKELEESRGSLEELTGKTATLKNELVNLRGEIAEKDEKLQSALSEIDNKDQEIIDKQVDIESLNGELESVKRQKESLKEELDSSGKTVEQRIRELNSKLDESESMAADAAKQVAELSSALDEKTAAYENRVFDLEQEVNQLRLTNTKNEDRVLKAFHKIKADAELRARTEKALTIALQILNSDN